MKSFGCVTSVLLVIVGFFLFLNSDHFLIAVLLVLVGVVLAAMALTAFVASSNRSNLAVTVEETDDEEDSDEEEEDEYGDAGCRQLHTIIVGTRYDNEDGTPRSEIIEDVDIGEALILRTYQYQGEPAVAVCRMDGEVMGNLKRDLAEEFAERIRLGQLGNTYLTKKFEDDEGILRCNVTINIKDEY